jgi:hypothetical protein
MVSDPRLARRMAADKGVEVVAVVVVMGMGMSREGVTAEKRAHSRGSGADKGARRKSEAPQLQLGAGCVCARLVWAVGKARSGSETEECLVVGPGRQAVWVSGLRAGGPLIKNGRVCDSGVSINEDEDEDKKTTARCDLAAVTRCNLFMYVCVYACLAAAAAAAAVAWPADAIKFRTRPWLPLSARRLCSLSLTANSHLPRRWTRFPAAAHNAQPSPPLQVAGCWRLDDDDDDSSSPLALHCIAKPACPLLLRLGAPATLLWAH